MIRKRRNLHSTQSVTPLPERGKGTAIVLSGGGPLGAVQVGMLRALFETGVRPDVFVACSVGALNGAFLAEEPDLDGVRRLEEIWRSLRTEDLFPGSTVRHAWKIARRHDHLYPNSGLIRLVTRSLRVARFDQLRAKLRIVGCEVATGEEHVFAAGPLLKPLLATTALPGVFPPVRIGTHVYVDGGVVNNVPINHAVPAERVYVLAVRDGVSQTTPTSSFSMLLHAFAISRANRFRLDVERYRHETDLVVLPQPPVPLMNFPDMSRTEELMDLGYRAAATFLDQQAQGDATAPCPPTVIPALVS